MKKGAFLTVLIVLIIMFAGCSEEANKPKDSENTIPGIENNTSMPTDTPRQTNNAPASPSATPFYTPEPETKIIEFYDDGLEILVRNIINKPEGDIYENELNNITEIYAIGDNMVSGENYSAVCYPQNPRTYKVTGPIKSLKDIAHFKNLKHLTLVYQDIEDFTPLTELKELESLNISDNKISDITFVKGMKRLKSLNVSYNKLTEISQIASLTNLKELDISNNKINNIKGLEKLTNLRMFLSNQSWTDDTSRIRDISPLKNMKKLEILSLEANRIADFNPISGLDRIKVLNLCQNGIKNIEPLRSLINMESLDLSWNDISDIRPLIGMKKLKKLKIDYDMVANKALLRQLPELSDVNFEWNKIPYPYTIGIEFAQEGIDPGNHTNQSPVGFDGLYLYLLDITYGDLPHPRLVKVDLETGEYQDMSGQITEQMNRISGASTGGWINEEVYSLNIYKGKLYYYGIGHNNDEADALEWGYYPGGDVIGLTRMNLDGSDREIITTELCRYINIKNDKIYYLNENSLPSRMELDGSKQEVLVNEPCKFLYATDEKLYYCYSGAEAGLMAKSLNDITDQIIINEEVNSPIILKNAIFYLNNKGNICKYEYSTGTIRVIKECNAYSLNMNYRYIFFAEDSNIFRMDYDGNNTCIISANGTQDLFVVGDYLFYYFGGGLTKIKDDGSEYTEYYEYY
jgi:Leucine-rich repeat (LRR) protein